MINKILRPYENDVLLKMVRDADKRMSYMNILTDDHFVNYDSKMIYNTIKNNVNMNEIKLLVEIENDSMIHGYLVNDFLQYYNDCDILLAEDSTHSLDKLSVNKRFRELEIKFNKINKLNPKEEDIQSLYDKVADVPSDLEYLTARNCFGIFAVDLNNKDNANLKPKLTGIKAYDEIIGGFTEGMHLIAGRAGCGKSSKASQVLARFADNNKDLVAVYFSAEMSKKAISRRAVSYFARIEYGKVKALSVSNNDINKLAWHSNKIPDNYIIVPCSNISTNEAQKAINEIEEKLNKKVGLVCFDYMQKMKPNKGNTRSEVEEFGAISNDVMTFAKEIPTILISNLNKPREGREYSCPTIYDIKGGSMLEFDATSVMMLWKQSEKSVFVHSRMLKNRDGENGTEATWKFEGAKFMFSFDSFGIRKLDKDNNNINEFSPF